MTRLISPAWGYAALVGTGGVGHGQMFALEGDHTLGREESRMGALLEARDYCKLHIISHYIAALGGMTVYPVSAVGQDAAGQALLHQMRQAGMDTRFMRTLPQPTLYSVCFLYPDATGGNITTSNSACAQVDGSWMAPALEGTPGPQMVLAAPEVSLEARNALLQAGRQKGAYTVASFASGEAEGFLSRGMEALCDLIAINGDEAAAAGGADALYARMRAYNPGAVLSVTRGGQGADIYAGGACQRVPGIAVPVVATGGAGDAFTAGLILGHAAGLPMHKAGADGTFGQTALATAPELATLIAAQTVGCADSIALDVSADSLRSWIVDKAWPVAPRFAALFGL
nr:carbohydrate kinase family protein [bacterium]